MNYADEIRRQAEAAPRAALPAVTAALWRAYGDGKVTEAEAEALSGLIEARRTTVDAPPDRTGPNDQQLAHRRYPPECQAPQEGRRLAPAHGCLDGAPSPLGGLWRLPPGLAARFTLAEQAVLALVAAETVRRKDCRLSIENMAAVAGVCRSTVKNAIREAGRLGLLTVEERQITGFRNDTNVVRVVSREWQAWLRLARREIRGAEGRISAHLSAGEWGQKRDHHGY